MDRAGLMELREIVGYIQQQQCARKEVRNPVRSRL